MNLLESIGVWALLLSSFIIYITPIIGLVPYAILLPFLMYYFGPIPSFFIAWVLTGLGSYTVFKFARNKSSRLYKTKTYKKHELKLTKIQDSFNNIRLEYLSVLLALPFVPAFLVNIAAGLSNMNTKKFMISAIIAKGLRLGFWSYIVSGVMDHYNNPINIPFVVALVVFAFVISKIVKRKIGIE